MHLFAGPNVRSDLPYWVLSGTLILGKLNLQGGQVPSRLFRKTATRSKELTDKRVLKTRWGMGSDSRPRLISFRTSLRARVALGVALPILVVLASLSFMRYRRERQLLEDQLRLTVLQLGEVMVGSLRHAMLTNDSEMLAQAVSDVGGMETIRQVQIIGLSGRVRADSHNEQVGTIWKPDDPGCIECHQFPAGARPRTTRFSALGGVLRISTPIPNESACAGCHAQENSHLGVLLADMSVLDIEERLRSNLRVDLAISIGSTVLVTLGLYLLIHWLVVRRVEAFRRPLTEFAAGDFASRLPAPSGSPDELGELANTFNRMADELDRHIRDQEERGKLRQRAIVEERERIARELHDGLAQLLGYVNTKAMAARLMLKKGQTEVTEKHLLQLEEAARELSVDVREAILGLKMAGQSGAGLAATLEDFVTQFSRLCGLPIELVIAPAVDGLSLTVETELQLLGIVQESLTNVRKHASATHIWINLRVDNSVLELTVGDDGRGFDPDDGQVTRRPHFGLSTMRERAEEIGAQFDLDSEPGAGTRITVRLTIEDSPQVQSKDQSRAQSKGD
jgi:signal transduction histidine kinase